MKMSEVFPRRFLGGDDLPHDVTVIIEGVAMEPVRNPKTRSMDSKAVVRFVGKKKALILNVTNGRALAALFGDESDGWVGKRIVIGADEVDSPQGRVRAPRVRPVDPNGMTNPPPLAAPEPEEDDEP